MTLAPDTVTFCVLSFEGPDRYAEAGGLAVRVTHLAETLARRGFETHLLFVGDPDAPGNEVRMGGQLTLHRWCQWISAYHPAGVYDGEEGKLRDFSQSVPPFLVDHVIRPALDTGRTPVILAEEWQTAEALIRVSDQLDASGLRQRCVLFWNANNTMSFHRVDWSRLNFVAQLTTVSRYMKHVMWRIDVNPLVIPNGIPADLLEPVNSGQVAALRRVLARDGNTVVLFKVGRFDPAKRWMMAVDAAAQLKREGHPVAFVLRGGIEPHGDAVLGHARDMGLLVADVSGDARSWEAMMGLLRAAGGLVFTGATGEDYVLGGQGAVALDTEQPDEIVSRVLDMREHPEQAAVTRREARLAAARFTWEHAIDVLLEKVMFVAHGQGLMPDRTGEHHFRRPTGVEGLPADAAERQLWPLCLPGPPSTSRRAASGPLCAEQIGDGAPGLPVSSIGSGTPGT